MATILEQHSEKAHGSILEKMKVKYAQLLKGKNNFDAEKERTLLNHAQEDYLSVEWKTINNRICLYFTFSGVFSYQSSVKGVEEWRRQFIGKENLKIVIVWNCLEMKGYEPRARVTWQKAMGELKNQIDTIWLVTNSSMIKTGAKIMSLAVSYDIKAISKESEMK